MEQGLNFYLVDIWWCPLAEEAPWYPDSVSLPGRSSVPMAEPGVGLIGASGKGVRVQISCRPSQRGEWWPILAKVGVVIGESPPPLMEKSVSLWGYETGWKASNVWENRVGDLEGLEPRWGKGEAQCSSEAARFLPVDLSLSIDRPSLPDTTRWFIFVRIGYRLQIDKDWSHRRYKKQDTPEEKDVQNWVSSFRSNVIPIIIKCRRDWWEILFGTVTETIRLATHSIQQFNWIFSLSLLPDRVGLFSFLLLTFFRSWSFNIYKKIL